MSFSQKITQQMKRSLLCVGLDSDYKKLPAIIKKNNTPEKSIFYFNKEIIDATYNLAIAFKMNIVFYSGYGIDGLKALIKTNEYIKTNYPHLKIIADCKRSEMLRSAELAAKELFDEFLFDAFTVTPWFGFDTIEPYLEYKDKAVFVPCHDSNPSAADIQDVRLQGGKHLYEHVTELVCRKWNKNNNVFIEAGLTYPRQLKRIRTISGDKMIILVVGLGAQGGKFPDIEYGLNSMGTNLIVSASRSIIFASLGKDFHIRAFQEAKKIEDEINKIRKKFARNHIKR